MDDWAYQANVRGIAAAQLDWMAGDGRYEFLDDKLDAAAESAANLLKAFAKRNLPNFTGNDNIRVRFPWNRMFEAEIFLGTKN